MDLLAGFIFDMDGVIVDSNPFHRIALQQFCRAHGFDLTDKQLQEKIYGRTNRDWIVNLFGNLPEETLNRYADEKEALYRKIYANDIMPVPGLIPFLEKLDSYDLPRAIATSAPAANVDFTLSKTGTQKFFSIILDDKDIVVGKPNPEIYLKTAASLKIPPDQCLVFEDSFSGVSAARAAGCKVIGITTTHSADELASVDIAIENFVGLDPKILVSKLF
ncbi:MAG TPA: HAD family phosphatase [Cyclobacteriaceae bacterium]|nr:HAD family phosphatase [Cyclobacteriaceae bacterium]